MRTGVESPAVKSMPMRGRRASDDIITLGLRPRRLGIISGPTERTRAGRAESWRPCHTCHTRVARKAQIAAPRRIGRLEHPPWGEPQAASPSCRRRRGDHTAAPPQLPVPLAAWGSAVRLRWPAARRPKPAVAWPRADEFFELDEQLPRLKDGERRRRGRLALCSPCILW